MGRSRVLGSSIKLINRKTLACRLTPVGLSGRGIVEPRVCRTQIECTAFIAFESIGALTVPGAYP